MSDRVMDWAIELQALAQAGLFYGKDVYDVERFQRIREIAAEMMAAKSGEPIEVVRRLFCNETGYQTPKMDSRAVVIRDNKVLLIQENDGLWALPGGWVDANLSVAENTLKELREEAGLIGRTVKLIAVLDRRKHPDPDRSGGPYGITSSFVLCEADQGEFAENSETIQSGWFALDELPPLCIRKTSPEQLEMCFRAAADEHWQTVFD